MDYFKWKELDRIEEDKPFTPRQTKEEIKLETDNFTLDKGVFRYGFEEEARIAVKYLEQKGYHAEMNITDNPLFAPEHESYNVWFSKEELPDGYESGEWLKEDLEEPEEYFVGSVAIAGTPEEAQKEFAGNGRVLIRASGTEPVVRVMIEGEDEEYITQKARNIAGIIENRLG